MQHCMHSLPIAFQRLPAHIICHSETRIFYFPLTRSGSNSWKQLLIKTFTMQIDSAEKNSVWFPACRTEDVPENGGVCVKYKDQQIALFYFTRKNEWYATQNECPHRQQMAISRGMIGTQSEEPKVACPLHKNTFSLKTGECLSGAALSLKVYPVKVEDGHVYIAV